MSSVGQAMRLIAAITACVWIASSTAAEDSGCSDPAPFLALEALRDRQDNKGARAAMQFLLNYRRFLCAETDSGRLPVGEAHRLFEEQRARILDEARRGQIQLQGT